MRRCQCHNLLAGAQVQFYHWMLLDLGMLSDYHMLSDFLRTYNIWYINKSNMKMPTSPPVFFMPGWHFAVLVKFVKKFFCNSFTPQTWKESPQRLMITLWNMIQPFSIYHNHIVLFLHFWSPTTLLPFAFLMNSNSISRLVFSWKEGGGAEDKSYGLIQVTRISGRLHILW